MVPIQGPRHNSFFDLNMIGFLFQKCLPKWVHIWYQIWYHFWYLIGYHFWYLIGGHIVGPG